MPATIRPAHDPEATGPRDWAEYAAMRAAHATMRRAAMIRANDALRVDRISAGRAAPHKYRAELAKMHDARRLYRTAARQLPAPDIAGAQADERRAAHAAARATLTATIRAAWTARTAARAAARVASWPVDPCPIAAPRCTGHARMIDRAALRAAARHLHPITRRRPKTAERAA